MEQERAERPPSLALGHLPQHVAAHAEAMRFEPPSPPRSPLASPRLVRKGSPCEFDLGADDDEGGLGGLRGALGEDVVGGGGAMGGYGSDGSDGSYASASSRASYAYAASDAAPLHYFL